MSKARANRTPRSRSAAPPRPSLLVVEDDLDTRLLIARLLDSTGCEVTIAENGVHGIICLGEEDYDLVLADINMPALSGLDLMEMVRQKEVDVPVVFLTACREDQDRKRAFDLGAADYLTKPVTREKLFETLEKVLRRRLPLKAAA